MSGEHLKRLFDYQRFVGNTRLLALMADTQFRYASALSDEELAFVNAAGEIGSPPPKEERHER